MRLLRLRAAVAAAIVCAATSASAGPWSLAPGESYSELGGAFSSSGTFYTPDGERAQLGGLWEQRTLFSYTELGWKKRASVSLRLPIESVTARLDGAHAPSTSTGLGTVELGLRYALWTGANAGALQFRWSAPLGWNRSLFPGFGEGAAAVSNASRYGYRAGNDTLADMGGGRQALELGLQTGWRIGGRAFLEAGAGYRYEFLQAGAHSQDSIDVANADTRSDWSDNITIDGVLGTWWSNRLQVAGLYRGVFSMASGRREITSSGVITETELQVYTQLAGPRVTYRVDDHLDAFAGSWHSPGGMNSLHVDRFYCGVAWKQTKLGRLQGFLGGTGR